MKILGVGDNKYICEIELNEMMTIMGMDNMYDLEEMLRPGRDVDMARTIKAARWIKQLDSEHINRVLKELQSALVGVERVKETAIALNLFNKLGEDNATN
jgi:hypothetical protein